MWMIGAGMLVAGLIVGFLVGWYWHKGSSRIGVDETRDNVVNVLATSTVPVLTTTYQTIDAPAFVSIDDQRAGGLVFVKHVEASKPTWIAVREIIDGSVGNILGAEMITSATDDVPVTLLRSTVSTGEYAIFLYQDNGDGQFDSKTDLLVMQNSQPVAAMFYTQ